MQYRYGHVSSKHRGNGQQTLLFLLVLALSIVSVSLAVGYSSASGANSRTRGALISRMQSEVTQAKDSAYRLSHTSGSQTENLLATVRQHVYAMRTVNEMAAAIYGAGNVLINEAQINACIGYLDQCDTWLQTGSVLTYTDLRAGIDGLFVLVQDLE
jgi:hypothetical protein